MWSFTRCLQVCLFELHQSTGFQHFTGTKLPGDLLLVHERSDHYSLQAATEMAVEGMLRPRYFLQRLEDSLSLELNSKITTFLTTYGKTLTKGEWLQKYPQPTETS